MICPVCNSDDTFRSGVIERFEKPLYIRQCKACRSFYQYPLPPDYENFYSDDYYSGKANYSYVDERKKNSYSKYVWDARINKLKKFQPSGIFLDVGCSFGGLVRSASRYYKSYGMDISEYAVEQGNIFSNQLGCNENFMGLHHGTLLDFSMNDIRESTVSIISMIEVVEHLANPGDHVAMAWKLLKPGGIFLVQTANMTANQAVKSGLDYHYFLPGHLTYFSQAGLLKLLLKTGFRNIIEFFPVEFSLLPKLRKIQGDFKTWQDYLKWIKVSYYHLHSSYHFGHNPSTSSYVVYAIK
ncbi:MAG: class I SAM-dependent methyltransferase [Spirochaetia bacterium]|nr:class I SAM-dependent methyltransferase [Spirochaetia bacterium]